MHWIKTFIIVMLFINNTQAKQLQGEVQDWKTFRNNHGYEFKYPSCWEVEVAQADEIGVREAEDAIYIAVSESSPCRSKKKNEGDTVGLAFAIYQPTYSSREEFDKKIRSHKKRIPEVIQRLKEQSEPKGIVTDGIDADGNYWHMWIERSGPDNKIRIRWEREQYCYPHVINVRGPTIVDPDASYFKKFKMGDMAIPEPAKTIFDSIKCIEAKRQRSLPTEEEIELAEKKEKEKNIVKSKQSKKVGDQTQKNEVPQVKVPDKSLLQKDKDIKKNK